MEVAHAGNSRAPLQCAEWSIWLACLWKRQHTHRLYELVVGECAEEAVGEERYDSVDGWHVQDSKDLSLFSWICVMSLLLSEQWPRR